MKKKVYLLSIFLIICCAILFIIFNHHHNNNENYYVHAYYESIKKYDSLIGKKISSIHIIIDEQSSNQLIVLYLFAAGDCSTCIDRGFSFIQNDISKLNIPYFVVSDNASISSIQDRNNYSSYIYVDDSGLIRRELKYCLTPVVFLLDSSKIIKTYFPKNQYDSQAQLDFIEEIKNFYNENK